MKHIYCALYVIKNTEEKYDMIWYMKIELKAKLPYNLNCILFINVSSSYY